MYHLNKNFLQPEYSTRLLIRALLTVNSEINLEKSTAKNTNNGMLEFQALELRYHQTPGTNSYQTKDCTLLEI